VHLITLINYNSGELEIQDDESHKARLNREASNRLIMTGRMHTVSEFVEKIPSLITDAVLLKKIVEAFEKTTNSSERWNLKEKFARLTTLTKGYNSQNPDEILEKVSF